MVRYSGPRAASGASKKLRDGRPRLKPVDISAEPTAPDENGHDILYAITRRAVPCPSTKAESTSSGNPSAVPRRAFPDDWSRRPSLGVLRGHGRERCSWTTRQAQRWRRRRWERPRERQPRRWRGLGGWRSMVSPSHDTWHDRRHIRVVVVTTRDGSPLFLDPGTRPRHLRKCRTQTGNAFVASTTTTSFSIWALGGKLREARGKIGFADGIVVDAGRDVEMDAGDRVAGEVVLEDVFHRIATTEGLALDPAGDFERDGDGVGDVAREDGLRTGGAEEVELNEEAALQRACGWEVDVEKGSFGRRAGGGPGTGEGFEVDDGEWEVWGRWNGRHGESNEVVAQSAEP
ncbi:hypothetical protein C8Q79DRAFT_939361 [Trametes meyenii]|nr:hypothetical protein C8Q79DRAFT_939361 [Trametes meyenii]